MSEQDPAIDNGPELAQPEALQLTAEERALLNALTPPEELLDSWREQFNSTIQTVTGSQLSPDLRKATIAAADRLGWELFGREGEPLPDTLALYQYSPNRDPDIVFHPSLQPYRTDEGALEHGLMVKLGPLYEEQHAFFRSRHEELSTAVAALIRSGPVYNFLKAFTVDQPATQDLPLSPMWRQIRENQIERETKRRYGLSDEETIAFRSPVDLALRRSLQGLDEETMPRKKSQKTDPIDKFNTWMIGETQHWLTDEQKARYGEVTGLTHIEYKKQDGKVSRYLALLTASGEKVECIDERYDWSNDLAADSSQPFSISNYDGLLGAYLLDRIYTKGVTDLSMALEQSVQEVAANEVDFALSDQLEELLISLRRPAGVIYTELPPFDTARGYLDLAEPRDAIDIHDAESIRWAKQTTIGHVTRRDGTPDTARLITAQDSAWKRPNEAEEYDMSIDFTQNSPFLNRFTKIEPYIPGFEVVANADTVWYFKRTDDDPYQASSHVMIDDNGRSRLVEQYRQLGARELASAIDQDGELSVAQLTQLISELSDYTLDTELPEHSKFNRTQQTIDDFANYVRSGRLQLQCTGASLFLAKSLEIALPASTATQVRGHVLTESNRIHNVGHAQTLLAYDGQQFLLDATPSAPLGLSATDGYIGSSTNQDTADSLNRMRRSGDHAKRTRDSDKDKVTTEISELATTNLQELLVAGRVDVAASARDQLEKILHIALEEPNKEALYKRIVALNKADPIRRALETVVQFDEGIIDVDEVDSTAAYLQNYLAADDTLKRKARLVSYDPTLVRLVLNTLSTNW